MSGLTRWNPLETLSRLDPAAEMDDMLRGLGLRSLRGGTPTTLELRTEITEREGAYQVNVDVPGVDKKDIDVSIDGRQVAITVESHRQKREEKDKVIYTERFEGRSYRAFTLPEEVDRTKAQARYEDGVLKLTLPRLAGNNAHRLAVQ